VKFLVDRCAGQRLAAWLRTQGQDVLASWEVGPDPGDRALLERAAAEGRVLVTIDTDFGALIYMQSVPHAGMVRLPDVPAAERIRLMAQVLERHQDALQAQAIITVRGGRIRVSRPPS
jgi:predicted nuclease of predicted toxin-antitoxin system